MLLVGTSLITEKAKAKVNLTLQVVGRREDGYHEIASLVAFADAPCDLVTLRPGLGREVHVEGPFGRSIAGENLVSVCLQRLYEREPRLQFGGVELEKVLPVAAGIGGGSADAAAALRAVRQANPAYAETIDWQAVALQLGADVPVCLHATASFMTGIGEVISPVPGGLPQLHCVLVNPLVQVPDDKTAQVFRRLAACPLASEFERPTVPGPFADARDLTNYMACWGNDMTAAACEVVPVVADVLAALNASEDCQLAALSGAGPTCFAIYPNEARARAAERQIASDKPDWWVKATVLG